MNKYIVGFDVETTGLSYQTDYIIQLAMVKLDKETFEVIDQRDWYIEPAHNYTIAPDALATHGITKEFLKEHGVSIKSICPDILDFAKDSDYLTYNGNSFDVRFLYKDMKLFGYDFPIADKIFYDAFSIYRAYNQNTLGAVYKRLTGKEIEDAHDAKADINATVEVFKKLKENYSLSYEDLDNMPENNMLSPEGSIRSTHSATGRENIVFAFGKYKDAEFCTVWKKDPLYVKWFGENIASDYTKKILNEYIRKCNV